MLKYYLPSGTRILKSVITRTSITITKIICRFAIPDGSAGHPSVLTSRGRQVGCAYNRSVDFGQDRSDDVFTERLIEITRV